jgi:hypothetical protein
MLARDTSVVEEPRYRIQADLDHHGGRLPARLAVAWRGHLTGLMEWGVLDRGARLRQRVGLHPSLARPARAPRGRRRPTRTADDQALAGR